MDDPRANGFLDVESLLTFNGERKGKRDNKNEKRDNRDFNHK